MIPPISPWLSIQEQRRLDGGRQVLVWHLGMRTNPESQPIRAPQRVEFSAKQRQGGQPELVSSSRLFSVTVLTSIFSYCSTPEI